jgi:Domain of unknown function (DUF3471)
MKYLAGITLAATIAFSASALAEDHASMDRGASQILAPFVQTADNSGAALDRYAGQYEADGGVEFVVTRDNNRLMIDLPESWGLASSYLHSDGSPEFYVDGLPMRVEFQADPDGFVTGMVVYAADGGQRIVATKLPRWHGIVTIHDVDDASDLKIAASN